ncbi:hypothetical protein [Phaeobacter italicus]|jgi:hypothetical protein|uniref:hypothetical protein n=1 Tax=Phaeobacter italicus TaxID=481446 RepID=UPI002FDE1159
MADNDLNSYRKTPPESEAEWQEYHRNMQRVNLMWPLVKPIHAFVSNLKAWAAIIAFFILFRSTEVSALLEKISKWAGFGK